MELTRALTAGIQNQTLRLYRWLLARVHAEAPPPLVRGLLAKHEGYLHAALIGGASFQILRTCHNVGLFKLLHERPGLSRSELAQELGLTEYAIEILLLGAVALHLCRKLGSRYFNDPLLSAVLGGATQTDGLGPILEYLHHVVNPALVHLQEAVRQNEPVGLYRAFGPGTASFYGAIARHAEYGRYFEEAMRADTQFNRDRVARSPVFARCRNILDVGGNTGELAIAIARHHPHAQITICDLPAVTAQAEQRLRGLRLQERITTQGCDLRTDGLPTGYDCVLFSHFLDIFSLASVRTFLSRAYAALVPGGRVCIFGSAVNDAETGPPVHCVMSSYFCCLADGEGRFYTARQLTEAMRGAGFGRVRRRRLPRDEVLLVGRRP